MREAIIERAQSVPAANLKKIWSAEEVLQLFDLPMPELMYQAQTVAREFHPTGTMQLSTLLNIKDGGCPEDCHYCPQAARYHTGVKAKKLLSVEVVREQVAAAKEAGATRFCMGAAWRELKDRDVPAISALIKEVTSQGLESCVTLGMVSETQASALKEAGLEYYNHNIDTSPGYYEKIITTRTQDDRLETLQNVRDAGIKVCSGGIVGMGEQREDRAGMLLTLANLDPQPESVPINRLVPVPGTPLENAEVIDPFELVRTIAVARIMFPHARIRLSAGRTSMSDELQAMCILAGVNSIHYGAKLLMTANPEAEKDRALLQRLGINVEVSTKAEVSCHQ
ncbi:MAG: biotin synthase BioB [Gammaproteobacteria bacterium]|nr:biotin synthase BioB [Gammaproteobacteria bacterium]